MTYRETPPEPPLVIAVHDVLIGVDPETGHERWQRSFASPIIRMFLAETRLFVASGVTLACLDVHTGDAMGAIALGFHVRAGFVRGQRLFLAGTEGMACISVDGDLLWNASVSQKKRSGSHQDSAPYEIRARSALLLREIWSAGFVAPQDSILNVGLLLEDQVAQPDL